MNIVLINAFDKLPGESFRDQRYTILYRKLKSLHYKVFWFSSDFHHWSHSVRKSFFLSDEDKNNIKMINTLTYNNNISLRRFFSHFLFSFSVLFNLIKLKNKPDVIITIAPVECLFLVALYCKARKIRLVVDVLDLWPDLFIEAFPVKLKPLGRILLFPYHCMANVAYKLADHITSVSKTYTDIALLRAGRVDIENSSYFYLGAPSQEMSAGKCNKSLNILKCLFAGQFGHNYDVELILDVAKTAQEKNMPIEFLLAGSGSKLVWMNEYISKHALNNVKLLGWLGTEELNAYAASSHVGLNTYKTFATQSIPTKIFDYMSMGLCVVNSLDGEVKELIRSDKSGVSYKSGSAEELLNALHNLQQKIEDVIEVGDRNKKTFQDKYTFDSIYDRMIERIF